MTVLPLQSRSETAGDVHSSERLQGKTVSLSQAISLHHFRQESLDAGFSAGQDGRTRYGGKLIPSAWSRLPLTLKEAGGKMPRFNKLRSG